MQYAHTIEYYSATKKVLTQATTYRNTMLSIRHQLQKTTSCMFPCIYLYEIPRIGKSIEEKSRLVLAWGQGLGDRDRIAEDDKKGSKIVIMVAEICEYAKNCIYFKWLNYVACEL